MFRSVLTGNNYLTCIIIQSSLSKLVFHDPDLLYAHCTQPCAQVHPLNLLMRLLQILRTNLAAFRRCLHLPCSVISISAQFSIWQMGWGTQNPTQVQDLQ